jgi:hypothetical protein
MQIIKLKLRKTPYLAGCVRMGCQLAHKSKERKNLLE